MSFFDKVFFNPDCHFNYPNLSHKFQWLNLELMFVKKKKQRLKTWLAVNVQRLETWLGLDLIQILQKDLGFDPDDQSMFCLSLIFVNVIFLRIKQYIPWLSLKTFCVPYILTLFNKTIHYRYTYYSYTDYWE